MERITGSMSKLFKDARGGVVNSRVSIVEVCNSQIKLLRGFPFLFWAVNALLFALGF